jgi:glucosamine--fructose-6-phosphate aminotransferase (isomerizing)
MCGIFGVVIWPSSQFQTTQIRKAFETMAKLSESRGQDASGILSWVDGKELVLKSPSRVANILKSDAYSNLTSTLNSISNQPVVLVGHTRMVTNGDRTRSENNQPVLMPNLAIFHNGIIVNEDSISTQLGAHARTIDVDTEAFGLLVESHLHVGESLLGAINLAKEQCEGANTYCCMSKQLSSLVLATTNGSMFYAEDTTRSNLIFGSEPKVVQAALENLGSEYFEDANKLKPHESFIFHVGSDNKNFDRALETIIPRDPVRSNGSFQSEDFSLPVNWEGIANLKRCTSCLLPETFPGLTFDLDGVCSKCQHSIRRTTLGIDSLLRLYETNVKSGMSEEVLVPLSGGRDSCYGLHYVTKVLGLPAIAYTYDWGFVTDLARRNISRMCGTLGVEHILVAADIDMKRANVHQNMEAWMRKPELGMIPLFMAGDKHFFKYASKLRLERNTSLTVFSMNWYEQTGFKTGFAGVRDDSLHTKTHGISNFNKLKLIRYYAGQFLSNPKYLNASLRDSLSGFSSFYLSKMDYQQLFDYIEWDEGHINHVLKSEYSWESGNPNRSTWRVGDASAAFYNYVYLSAVGFTEFDTFRSNQIRAGQLSRETALSNLQRDNNPNVQEFVDYCNLIDIDPELLAQTIRGIGVSST